MTPQPDVLVAYYCSVSGENGDMLGVDESAITNVHWVVVDVVENKILKTCGFVLREETDDIINNNDDDTVDNKEEEEKKSNKKTGSTTITLRESIVKFEEMIKELSTKERVVRIVTENGFHLRQCLHPRSFCNEIELPDIFYKYIDLQKEYGLYKEKSAPFRKLREIADDMIIQYKGDLLDSSEKKCKFCARVIQHLLKEGHKFTRTEEISRSLDSGMISGYVKDDTIVRARGLPWQVSDVDVAEFFVGLNISKGGVALCLNLKGRRNGEALVRFESQEHRDMALRRHKHHLLGRYIEVYKGTAQDFLKIAKGPAGAMQAAAVFLTNGGEVIVRMRGLPFDATISDIVKFFGDSPKVYHGDEGVMLVSHSDGSPTGDAFVLFETENEGQLALKKHRENIGKRYVELFRSTRAELQQVLTMYNVGYQLLNPVSGHMYHPVQTMMADRAALMEQRLQALMNMSCLRMRGLPFSAVPKDILSFLGNHTDSVIGTVHIIYNLQGRPSGEAFVQMKNPDQAHKCANDLHLKHMGERYIEVFQCSVQDMTWMLATSHANQQACLHLNQINNNNNNKNIIKTSPIITNNKTTYQPTTPSPPPPPLIQTTQSPPMNGILASPPAPITTTAFFTSEVSPMPLYTGPFPAMFPPMPQQGFLPPPPPQLAPRTTGVAAIPTVMPPMCHQDSMQFPVTTYAKPGLAYITFNSPEEAQRMMHEKHQNKYLPAGNTYVEMFIAH